MTETIASESDARTTNNAVRHTYRILSEDEKAQMVALKNLGAAFIAKCNDIGKSRGTDAHKGWSVIHRASPGPDRAKFRSTTFPGMAEACADQWGLWAKERMAA